MATVAQFGSPHAITLLESLRVRPPVLLVGGLQIGKRPARHTKSALPRLHGERFRIPLATSGAGSDYVLPFSDRNRIALVLLALRPFATPDSESASGVGNDGRKTGLMGDFVLIGSRRTRKQPGPIDNRPAD
jgi:hypothetical protein